MTSKEVAAFLDVSDQTLAQWRYKDRGLIRLGKPRVFGPAWIERQGKCRGYLEEDVIAFVREQRTA